uniref:Peptidase S1 domain-containing protein n=1 Tax=Romanomermis culicivorax TaxID=13658 RepID=A0A915KW09_ROMCU
MNAFSHMDPNIRQKRIIDGYTPEPYHMPWIGLLVKDGKARCTTFLVSKKANTKASVWVLSAKHCFYDVLLDEYEDKKVILGVQYPVAQSIRGHFFLLLLLLDRVSCSKVLLS